MIVYITVDLGYHDNATMVMVIDHFALISCGILTIVKIALIQLHRDDLLKSLCNAASDWMYITKQDHRQVMFRYTNLGRFVFFFQMGSSYFVITPLIIGPLLFPTTLPASHNVTLTTKSEKEMRVMELPQEMICPFDDQIVCYGIYILQTVQLIGTATGNAGSDVFFFGVCMHLCGQLEVLSLQLLRFHEGNDCWKRTKMVTLIERHSLLLNLAKDIVNILDIILIAQLIVHSLLMCLLGNLKQTIYFFFSNDNFIAYCSSYVCSINCLKENNMINLIF